MRRLVAGGMLPERAGQQVKVWAHVSLAELRAMDDGSLLETEWVTEMRIRWAAHRAEAEGGGGAWLGGDAARALSCDAIITPVVTATWTRVLDDLVRLCLALAGHGARCVPQPAPAPADPASGRAPAGPAQPPVGLAQLTGMSRQAIRQAIIGKTTFLLLHSQ